MQDAHLAEARQSPIPVRPESQQRQRQDQQFEGEENFDYHVDRKTGWRCYREPRETRRQHLNLQHRSGKTHNGRRFGSHGSPHHLINGGDFGFLERIPENRRVCRQDTHSQDICAVQFHHSAHRTINAHGSRIAYSSLCLKRV